MILRHFKEEYQKFISFVFALLLPFVAICSSKDVINEKRAVVAMRMIGHEVLLCLGDGESRVMPIEKIDEHFKIPFEFEFGFDPDDIISIIDRVMLETGIATDYLVEVEQCETKEIVHSFMIRNDSNPDIIACRGRLLPKDCYSLLITLLVGHNTIVNSNESSPMTPLTSVKKSPIKTALMMVPLLFLIGIIGFSIKKKTSADEDQRSILIGSTLFDTRNMTLSFENKRVGLSNKEAELLSLLHTSVNSPIEREVILQKVWGDEGAYVGRTLDVFISKLRKKLEADASVKITNIRGIGYKLMADVSR